MADSRKAYWGVQSSLKMETYRSELNSEQRHTLLQCLQGFTYTAWIDWFIQNLDAIQAYALNIPSKRKKILQKSTADAIMTHHGAMYLYGLYSLAKENGLPDPEYAQVDKMTFAMEMMAAIIKAYENLNVQHENGLFWPFDEPYCESGFPFSDRK